MVLGVRPSFSSTVRRATRSATRSANGLAGSQNGSDVVLAVVHANGAAVVATKGLLSLEWWGRARGCEAAALAEHTAVSNSDWIFIRQLGDVQCVLLLQLMMMMMLLQYCNSIAIILLVGRRPR